MTWTRHSIRCWCDGCARSRRYISERFPDPEALFRAAQSLTPDDDPDDVHAFVQNLIAAYQKEVAA